uniref:Uncharacterized protein n=1 Tax=Micrurus lemniscatus lemniscatus TaxID=129467 RepID=A0A2D4HVR5_MICLE
MQEIPKWRVQFNLLKSISLQASNLSRYSENFTCSVLINYYIFSSSGAQTLSIVLCTEKGKKDENKWKNTYIGFLKCVSFYQFDKIDKKTLKQQPFFYKKSLKHEHGEYQSVSRHTVF